MTTRKKPRNKGVSQYATAPFEALFVAETPATYTVSPMTARVFQSGNSQAVRLPREFRVDTDELLIFRRGDEIVLRERPLKPSALVARAPQLPDDFPDEIPDPPPEPLEGS